MHAQSTQTPENDRCGLRHRIGDYEGLKPSRTEFIDIDTDGMESRSSTREVFRARNARIRPEGEVILSDGAIAARRGRRYREAKYVDYMKRYSIKWVCI